jgi:hypothetical protein
MVKLMAKKKQAFQWIRIKMYSTTCSGRSQLIYSTTNSVKAIWDVQIATGINDTGGKFATGVIDTGGK